MKTKYFYLLLIIFSSTIFIAGCYTQIATRDNDYSKDRDEYGYYDQEEDYDSNYVADEYNGDYEYEDDADIVINKYHFGNYPTYQRYFWGYHPSIYYIGFSFGNWYYDPFCWDPFDYWNWCGSYWYYPGYYSSYYNPYYYPNYNWGYGYNDYSYGYNNRERTRDNYSIRNNSGLRNSYVTRGSLTGRDSRTLNKDIRSRERSRDVLLDRNTTSRNRNLEKERTGVKKEERRKNPVLDNNTRNRRDDNTIRKSPKDRQNETRKRSESIFKDRSKENKTTPPRKVDTRKRELNKNSTPNIKKENSGTRQRTESKNRNETRIERRSQETPRSYSPPQRTYSPPSNNNTPRSSSPPQSSPPSGNTNRGGDRRR